MEYDYDQIVQTKMKTTQVYEKALESLGAKLQLLKKEYRDIPPQDEAGRNALQLKLDELLVK